MPNVFTILGLLQEKAGQVQQKWDMWSGAELKGKVFEEDIEKMVTYSGLETACNSDFSGKVHGVDSK